MKRTGLSPKHWTYVTTSLGLLSAWILTVPFYFADSVDFVQSVVRAREGDYGRYLEFGHLWWRPFGHIVSVVLGPLFSHFLSDDRQQVFTGFVLLNLLSSVVIVYSTILILERLRCDYFWISVVCGLVIFSENFLNFGRTGAPYITGLAFVLLSLYFATRDKETLRTSSLLLSSAFAAIATSVWLLYLWSIPAILMFRLIVFGSGKPQLRYALSLTLVIGVLITGIYATAILSLGLTSVPAINAWRTHGPTNSLATGIARVTFGLPKLLLYFGPGLEVKRYFAHDIYHSVSASMLVLRIAWKVVLFFFAIAALLLALLRGGKQKFVTLFIIGLLPILCFALFMDGGAKERFLPFLPFLVVSLGVSSANASRTWKASMLLLLVATISVNVSAMSRWNADAESSVTARQLLELQSRSTAPVSLLTLSVEDQVVRFQQNHFLDTVGRESRLRLFTVIPFDPDSVYLWKERTEEFCESARRAGVRVWVKKDLTYLHPTEDAYWIEGPATSPKWAQISGYFRSLRYVDSTTEYLALGS